MFGYFSTLCMKRLEGNFSNEKERVGKIGGLL